MFNVMMLVCETGKTIKKDGKVQYGRVTRHKDVFLCSVCAMGFYLVNRFYNNAEFFYDEMNNSSKFFINEEWMDRKLIVGMQTRDPFKSLSPKNFETSMKSVLRELGIQSSHFAHFGRVNGPILCELASLNPQLTKQLGTSSEGFFYFFIYYLTFFTFDLIGNWARDVQDTTYSAKIPFDALLVMAGYQPNDTYWLPRQRIEPPSELRNQLWPWVDYETDFLKGCEVEKPTALQFMDFLFRMRDFIFQDVAAMQVICEDRLSTNPDDSWALTRMDHTIFKMP